MYKSVGALIKAHSNVKREVYLDLENSSPVPKEVVEEMLPYFKETSYGNPVMTHKQGWMAYETIIQASQKIASFIGASSPEELTFTHDETEANNLSIMGVALANKDKGNKILISEIEPLSILYSSDIAKRNGFVVEKVPVDKEGFVDSDKLVNMVDGNTILVSIAAINNEIGTIQNIGEIAKRIKEKNPNILFHSDASDAYGRIPIDIKKYGLDLMTLSSFKILGPRGVGVLYVREGVRVDKLIDGPIGTQQFWPGVENTPLIVGFRKASELAFSDFEKNRSYMIRLRDKLMEGMLTISETILNGPKGEQRAADNVNISVLRCEGEALTIELSLNGVYVSSGSACTRRLLQPSHVLVAIGRRYEAAHGSILMKVTRYHNEEDMNYVLEVAPKAIKRIRSIGPEEGF